MVKVFVLRHNRVASAQRMLPDERVGRSRETEIPHVLAVGKQIGQVRGQIRREILVKQEFHAAWLR